MASSIELACYNPFAVQKLSPEEDLMKLFTSVGLTAAIVAFVLIGSGQMALAQESDQDRVRAKFEE